MTIRNGLYHIRIEMLDAVQGGNQGVMVLRDGRLIEMYSFVAVTYFILCFSLSVFVKRLQKKFAVIR